MSNKTAVLDYLDIRIVSSFGILISNLLTERRHYGSKN
jgi:hypothetical protein